MRHQLAIVVRAGQQDRPDPEAVLAPPVQKGRLVQSERLVSRAKCSKLSRNRSMTFIGTWTSR